MADDVLKSFAIALGFVTKGKEEAKRSIADYEKAVRDAEKRIEDARWKGAKTEEEIAKLTRETNLKLAREALANAQAREKVEAEQTRKRKENADAFVKGLERMAIAATAAVTAIGYAFAKIAGSFDNLYFQAQRAGTSVQSLKAISYAFSQTGGSAQQAQASVDSFTTKIRNNPGLRQFVKDLGVDDKLQGVDKYIATLDAIKTRTAGTPFVGVQYAEMLGVSEENYNLFLRQGDALKAYKAEYDALSKSLNFNSDKSAEGATAFSRALTRLQVTVGILVEKLLTALAPALQAILDKFQAWIQANPGALEKILNDIAKAITYVAEGIAKFIAQISGDGGDAFLKRWDAFVSRAKAFAETVERIVYGIEKLLKLLHLTSGTNTVLGDPDRAVRALNAITGGSAAPDGPGGARTGNAVPPDDRSFLQRILPKSLGGRDAPAAGDGSRSWRNNNPGNIKFGSLAESMGATGADAGGFARFPSYEAGRKAQEKLLFESKSYKDLTIKSAIARWAPAGDGSNDPEAYAGLLAKAAGVGVDTPLSSLNADQRSALLDAQQKKEGWIPGKASIAAGVQKGGESAPYLSGQLTLDGKAYDYGSGNGKGKNSIPIGTYPVTPGTIGPWGQANNALGINNNQIWDKTLNRMRDGIEFHAASNAAKLSAGCIAIAKEQYGAFRSHVLDFVKKNGSAYLTVRPDGSAMITATPPQASEGARTTQIGANVPKIEGGKAAGSAAPNLTPGGFDVNAITTPRAPMGTGAGSSTSTTDARSVTQHIHNDMKVTGVEKPADHARAIESTLSNVHQMSLHNAQSALA